MICIFVVNCHEVIGETVEFTFDVCISLCKSFKERNIAAMYVKLRIWIAPAGGLIPNVIT